MFLIGQYAIFVTRQDVIFVTRQEIEKHREMQKELDSTHGVH